MNPYSTPAPQSTRTKARAVRFREHDEVLGLRSGLCVEGSIPLPVVPAKAGIQRLVLRSPKQPCVYLLANRRNGTIYVGVTSNLVQRVWQHKSDFILGFTRDHQVHRLVWFEQHVTMYAAVAREKAIKKWNRAWKVDLIEKSNSYWRDLYAELI